MGLKGIMRALCSLRITIVCLAFAIVLIFAGTMAQVNKGIFAVQAEYFRSFFVFWQIPGMALRIPVLPGGYLLGLVLLVNLVCSLFVRIGFRWRNFGLLLVHVGLILLLLGQVATDMLARESMMRLAEGQTKNYSEAERACELAVVDESNPKFNEVVTIPDRRLAEQSVIQSPKLPFRIKVLHYWPNSTQPVTSKDSKKPPLANRGIGRQLAISPAPPETRTDRRNVPTAYIELLGAKGPIGTWAVSEWVETPQTLTYDGHQYALSLRLKRYYTPFAMKLLKFTHINYPGTQVPKTFSSRVRLIRPATGEDRQVLIYMNHPLRYGGDTFYQASYEGEHVSILQVVHNPSWITPYVACALVGIGLAVQFLRHLIGFVRKQRHVPTPASS